MSDDQGLVDETLEEAKARLFTHIDEGMTCPCCGQFAKRYKRAFNSGQAISLINIYKTGMRSSFEWVYIPSLSAKSREEGKIAYWGLLQEKDEERDDGGRAGYWRVTPRGEQFVINKLRIPKYVYVYNGTCLGFDHTEMVTIRDCLGNKFDLATLMGW
jgi:hypothetical protein